MKLILAAISLTACTTSSSAPRKAYIGLYGDNAIAAVDTTTWKVVTTIPVTAPDGLVITPDGKKVYVSSNNTGAVAVIDTATETVATTISVGAQPAGIAIAPDGGHIVVSVQGDGFAAIIDTGTDTVLGKTPIGKAHNGAISADGALAFIASQVSTAPAVDVVAMPGGAAGATFALDAAPRALCDLGGTLYVSVAGSAAIESLDAASGAKGASITTGGSPHDIRPTVDAAYLLTVSQTAGELEQIDPRTVAVIAHVPTGTMPHWIGLSSDGALAVVTNEGDNNISVVDLATHAVTQSYPVGAGPRKIAIQP